MHKPRNLNFMQKALSPFCPSADFFRRQLGEGAGGHAPDAPERHIAIAGRHMQNHDYYSALSEFEKAMALGSQDGRAYLGRGACMACIYVGAFMRREKLPESGGALWKDRAESDLHAAEGKFREELKASPESHEAAANLSRARYYLALLATDADSASKLLESAGALMQRAVRNSGIDRKPAYYDELSTIYAVHASCETLRAQDCFDLGDRKGAASHMGKAARLIIWGAAAKDDAAAEQAAYGMLN